jgi:hypothetical protein
MLSEKGKLKRDQTLLIEILYAIRWDASLATMRSLAFVFAWDLTPMIPPPHCLRNSSNRSLKLACIQYNQHTMNVI